MLMGTETEKLDIAKIMEMVKKAKTIAAKFAAPLPTEEEVEEDEEEPVEEE